MRLGAKHLAPWNKKPDVFTNIPEGRKNTMSNNRRDDLTTDSTDRPSEVNVARQFPDRAAPNT